MVKVNRSYIVKLWVAIICLTGLLIWRECLYNIRRADLIEQHKKDMVELSQNLSQEISDELLASCEAEIIRAEESCVD
jgi:hypothetical protein